MSLPSCSTGVSGTMFGVCVGGGTGPKICPELGLGNRRIPPASAHAMVTRGPAKTRCILTFAFLDQKYGESGPSSHEEGPCDVVGGPGRHRAGSRPDR